MSVPIERSTESGGPGAAHRGVIAGRARELWRFRFMLRSLILRDLKVKYKRSTLGFLWTFLNPLLTVGILIAVFRIVIRIPLEHYWAFLLSGYFAWNAVQHMLLSSSYILQTHSGLLRSTAFPKEVLLFGAAISRLIELAIELTLILAVLGLVHHQGAPIGFAFLPLLMLLLAITTAGFMFPIATASVLFTDVQHTLPILTTSLFYLTPIFYPADMVPESFRGLYFANPFARLITLFHQALYEGRVPDGGLLLGTAAIALGLFAAGYAIFNRYKDVCNELV
ncbi:MAG: ABC transporter permease [Candidatus Eisenbacteria bacterium]|nr:ABC transporter permease [Candidatus Eisenbacteria bacterium]